MKKSSFLACALNVTAIFILLSGSKQLNAQAYFNPPNTSFTTGTGPSSITTGDFNADGKKDVAIANTGSNNVSVFLGTGTGSFGAALNIGVGTGPYAVVSADFNGDNKLDIASCNAGTNNVSILLGNGNGTFGAAVNFGTANGPRGITSGDLNGDSNIDLVTANYNSGNISVLLGAGNGTFGAATNFPAGTGPRAIITAKLNADAILDLAVSNETSNNVSILIGSGTGTFGAATNFNVGTNPRSITYADFNGDLNQDLATANASNNISVLLGTGTGSFGAATNFVAGIIPYSITNADFNNDGKIDLAVANLSSDNYNGVSVFMGTGTGSFSPAKNFQSTIWTVAPNPDAIVSGDFNTDGKPDLVVANYLYNTFSILKSFSPTVGTCAVPMRIVILGASTSFGFGATVFDSAYAYRYRKFIIDSINGYSEIINLAHAGYTTYAIQPNGHPVPNPYVVDTIRNITKAISYNPDAVLINFTTNDINGLVPMDTIKNNFLRVTNMLDGLGIPYWITTTQPRNFTGDPPATILQKKQLILDLRDTIMLLYPQNYIESYVGFADVNGDILPQFDCGDNTHFTDAGHRKLFNNFKAKGIQNILCSILSSLQNETAPAENYKLYPNPFENSTTLLFDNTRKEEHSLIIFDCEGRQVRSINIGAVAQTTIDKKDLASGLYFFMLRSSSAITVSGKFIIE